MKDSHYNKLVDIIHRHRSWVDVLRPKEDATLVARSGVDLMTVRRRVMTLVALRPRSVYPKGHVWNIPEERLDRAVRAMKRNRTFTERWKREELSVSDAEALVLRASNNFLSLNLQEE
ncbi:MAG: hypothetical protein NC252_08080 [Roseburia sp.]|nr:hypothetical protein [Roseburia sp.]MCM1421124.1 hypothetical protein [Bacteroides sp.]MCM1511105.1 hypothetical protein [Clostridium sp.]